MMDIFKLKKLGLFAGILTSWIIYGNCVKNGAAFLNERAIIRSEMGDEIMTLFMPILILFDCAKKMK